MKRPTLALLLMGVVLGLGGLWWWALLGMEPEVGFAIGVTSMILLYAGFVALIFPEDF